MPKGIILSSGSEGATKEDVEKVFAANGIEVDKPPETAEVAEPKRDDFDTEEEFEAAHVDWQGKQKTEEKGEEEEEEEDEEVAPRKPSKFQKRVNKLAREIADRETAALQRRIEALEGKGEKKETPKAATENPRPKRAEFDAGDEGQQKYEDALLAWGVAKANAEKNAKDSAESEKDILKRNLTEYGARVEEFKETVDDWDEVVGKNQSPIHKAVELAIIEQENGPAVSYYLCTHPVYAKKLSEMTPLSAVMEVGRLSERLLKAVSGSPAPGSGRRAPDKPKPRVPAPVRPVSTAATSSTLTSADAAKNGNFKAFKAAQRAGR